VPDPPEPTFRGAHGPAPSPCRTRRPLVRVAPCEGIDPAVGLGTVPTGVSRPRPGRPESACDRGVQPTSTPPAFRLARMPVGAPPRHPRAGAAPVLGDGPTSRRHAPPNGRSVSHRHRATREVRGARSVGTHLLPAVHAKITVSGTNVPGPSEAREPWLDPLPPRPTSSRVRQRRATSKLSHLMAHTKEFRWN